MPPSLFSCWGSQLDNPIYMKPENLITLSENFFHTLSRERVYFMELKQSQDIPLPVDKVWSALNDDQILAQAIPGCQELTKISDTELTAKVKLKVGPVSATFNGEVILSELSPPHSYMISGTGKGGVAGSATGSARVELEAIDNGSATRLTYDVDAAVTGKIAQLGSRLIESTAKKLATKFFTDFIAILLPESEQS